MPSGCYRLDLNDLYGEVVRQWGGDELVAQTQHGGHRAPVLAMRYGGDRSGALVVTTLAEGSQPYGPRGASSTCAATLSSSRRRRRTTILWAPTCARSRRCSNMRDDWARRASLNRMTAWTLTNKMKDRFALHQSGAHDGSVDLLVTGCEVSLWLESSSPRTSTSSSRSSTS